MGCPMLKSHASAPLLAGLLNLLLSGAHAGIRTGVSVNGTTVGPNFSRAEGILMAKCPDSHPYPIGGGLQCCRVSLKVNNSSLSSDCDGGRVKFASSAECCAEGMMQPCSDQEGGCNLAKNICQPKPTVVSSSNPYSALYSADKMLFYVKCEIYGSETYFLGKNGNRNVQVVLDFGCQVTMSKIYLRNTQNGSKRDRGTKDFLIELSQDMGNWSLLVDDTLPDVRSYVNADCDLPIFSFDAVGFGRYLRFVAKNYHGSKSVGLNYMTWKFEL